MSKRKKVIIVIAAVVLLCLIISAVSIDFANNILEQNGDILIYDGVEYLSTKHTDIIADVSTFGYRKVGYGALNFIPMPVYAERVDSPEYLVFYGGSVVYFLKDAFPDRLSTEYAEIHIECIESGIATKITGPLTFSSDVLDPICYALEDPARDAYLRVARIVCFFANPHNVQRTVRVYENDGVYYLEDSYKDANSNDYKRYCPVIEGSKLHLWILEVVSGNQTNE